jgi:hypothetical protein
MKRSQYIATKKMEGEIATKTLLTVDFKDWTIEQFADYAFGKAAITWQSSARKSDKPIPTEATYYPTAPGATATPLTIDEQIERLSPEAKAELIAKLTA